MLRLYPRMAANVGYRPLCEINLFDLQNYYASLEHYALATRGRRLSAVKSLLSFGVRSGYLKINVGALVKLPKINTGLAQRILTEDEVTRLIALEYDQRNH